jgi:hypothetical protein
VADCLSNLVALMVELLDDVAEGRDVTVAPADFPSERNWRRSCSACHVRG